MSITNISNLNLDKSISEDGAWSLISVKSCCSSNPNWITMILYCQRSIFNLHITILRYQTNTFPISPCQTKWQEQGEKPNHCSSAPTVVLHQQSPVLTVGLWGAGSPTSSSVSSQTESECGPTPTADCPSHHHLSVIERTHKHISRTHTPFEWSKTKKHHDVINIRGEQVLEATRSQVRRPRVGPDLRVRRTCHSGWVVPNFWVDAHASHTSHWTLSPDPRNGNLTPTHYIFTVPCAIPTANWLLQAVQE